MKKKLRAEATLHPQNRPLVKLSWKALKRAMHWTNLVMSKLTMAKLAICKTGNAKLAIY